MRRQHRRGAEAARVLALSYTILLAAGVRYSCYIIASRTVMLQAACQASQQQIAKADILPIATVDGIIIVQPDKYAPHSYESTNRLVSLVE